MNATDDRYRDVEGYSQSVAVWVARMWSRVNPKSVRRSWRDLSVDAYAYISIGQMAAAAGADPYVGAVVPGAVALGEVQPRAFAGVASDGRNLLSLLQQPAIKSVIAMKDGAPVERAMEMGANSLRSIAVSMVTDAARAAEHTAIAARPDVVGYVRTLNPPTCARCAILAGAYYRWNQGFERHPRCDCTHVPVTSKPVGRPTAPRDYFNSLSKKDQDRYFGKESAELIRSGKVDMIKHVSAKTRVHSEMKPPSLRDTGPSRAFTIADESAHAEMLDTYRRAANLAMAGDIPAAEALRIEARALSARAYAPYTGQRLMPEQLTQGASRAEAIAGLSAAGYLK